MNAETWRSLEFKDQVSWDQISGKGKSTILNYAKQRSSNSNNDGLRFKPRYVNKTESNVHEFEADVHEFVVEDDTPGAVTDNSDSDQVQVEVSTHHFEVTDNNSSKIKKSVSLNKENLYKYNDAPTKATMLLQAATTKNRSYQGLDINKMMSQAVKPREEKPQIGRASCRER